MLSDRVKHLKPSATLALNAKAQELARSGRDIISFAVGEPDWDTFENIKRVTHEAIDAGFTKYTPAAGIPELRKAVVETIQKELGLTYDWQQCTIGIGAKQVIFNLLQVLCNPGDEVIIPSPYWVSYPTMVELAEAKPVIALCPKETNFKLTPDILKNVLSAKTKAIILNSPNNPTGQVYTADELKNLAKVLELTAVWVISDDIYDKMIFNGTPIAAHIAQQSEKLRPQVLLVNSVSKTYSMTGWRIGSLVGDKRIVDAVTNYQSQSASCPVSFAQKGAVEALKGPQNQVTTAMNELGRRRELALKALKAMPPVTINDPHGAFYLFPSVAGCFGKTSAQGAVIENSADFCAALLEQEGVAIVPGIEFGAEGFVRLSYTVSEQKLVQGLERIGRFVASLK